MPYKRYLFLDLEVLEDYFSLTYSDYNKEPITLVNPTRSQITNLITSRTLVGYNIRNYDLIILYYYLNEGKVNSTDKLRKLSNYLLDSKTKGLFSNKTYVKNLRERLDKADADEYLRTLVTEEHLFNLNRFENLNQLDFTVVELLNPNRITSLKKLDMYLNNSVNKFDLETYTSIEHITKDGLLDVFKEYEKNDVRLLSQIFSEIEYKTFGISFKELLDLMNEITNYYNVEKNRYYYSNPVNRTIREVFFNLNTILPETKIKNYVEATYKLCDPIEKQLVEDLGVEEQTSKKGGINYVRGGIYKGNIIDIDVASMYPDIMLQEEVYSLIPSFNYGLYKEFFRIRLELKKNNDKFNLAYKILLNSTFGYLDQIHKDVIIKPTNIVTVTGRKYILDIYNLLVKKFDIQLLNIVTDGILAVYPDNVTVEEVVDYVNANIKLTVEGSKYTEAYMDKPNNYFLKGEKNKGKGLFVIKEQTNTILPVKTHPYLTNKTLSELFKVELPKVEYVVETDKGIAKHELFFKLENNIQVQNYTTINTGITNIDYLKQNHFSSEVELPDYLKVFKPYVNHFITKKGAGGKIHHSKEVEELGEKGVKAVTSFLENDDLSLAIKPKKKILIVDIDEPVGNYYQDTYTTFNPVNNHLKKVYTLENNQIPQDEVQIKTKIMNDYNLTSIDNIEIFYKMKAITLWRDNEKYFNIDTIKPFNEVGSTITDKEDLAVYEATSDIVEIMLKVRPNYTHYKGNYFNCPTCYSLGKVQVFKNKTNVYINKCLKHNCLHKPEKIILQADNTELELFIEEEVKKKIVTELQTNTILQNLISLNDIQAPTGSGKTRALAFLSIYTIMKKEFITIVAGNTNEQCDNLYEYIEDIVGKDSPLLNSITRAYGESDKTQLEVSNYVTITNFYHITPYLKASLNNIKQPKYITQIKDSSNKLYIDEYQLFYKGLTTILQIKGYCKRFKNINQRFKYQVIRNYHINLDKIMTYERLLKDIEYKPLVATTINKLRKGQKELNTIDHTFADEDVINWNYSDLNLKRINNVKSYKYVKGSKILNQEHFLFALNNDIDFFNYINKLEKYNVDIQYLKEHVDKIYIYEHFVRIDDVMKRVAEFLIIQYKEETLLQKATKITATPPKHLEAQFVKIETTPKTLNVEVNIINDDISLNKIDKPFIDKIHNMNSSFNTYFSKTLIVLSGTMQTIEDYIAKKSLSVNYRKKHDYFYNNSKQFKGIADTIASSSKLLIGSNLQEYDNIILTDLENTPRPLLMLNDDKSVIYSKITQIFGRINRGTNKDTTRLFLPKSLLHMLVSYELDDIYTGDIPLIYKKNVDKHKQNYEELQTTDSFNKYQLYKNMYKLHYKCDKVRTQLAKALQGVSLNKPEIKLNVYELEDICMERYDNFKELEVLPDDIHSYLHNNFKADAKLQTKIDKFLRLIN